MWKAPGRHRPERAAVNAPEFDDEPWESRYRDDYGYHVTVADMLRQVARDEELHKEHSDSYIRRGARFSRLTG
jgi:hypothetical protein